MTNEVRYRRLVKIGKFTLVWSPRSMLYTYLYGKAWLLAIGHLRFWFGLE